MPNLLAIIGESWRFYKKQPVLNHVLLWFVFLPLAVMFFVSAIADVESPIYMSELLALAGSEFALWIIVLLTQLGLSLWLLFGSCAVLVIAKRMIKSPAGRSRTSLSAVRKQATGSYGALLLTYLLRECITILWALLFIVPCLAFVLTNEPLMNQVINSIETGAGFSIGTNEMLILGGLLLLLIPAVLYQIRTTFYSMIVVCTGQEYRAALRASRQLTAPRLGATLLSLIVLSTLVFMPLTIITDMLSYLLLQFDVRTFVLAGLLRSTALAFGKVFFLLCLVVLYREFTQSLNPQHGTA